MPAHPPLRPSLACVLVVLASGLVATPASAAPDGPDFELPFACGEQWAARSRPGHSPSYYSIDFSSGDDLGHPVLATTTGRVASAIDLGNTSYGRHIVVDHNGRWSSLYAHLEKMLVSPGQWVDQGQVIGLLGSSGGSSGPHLHFEERLDRTDQPAYFHRTRLAYNRTVQSMDCPDVPVSGNWDGRGGAQVGVWRRGVRSGVFSLRRPDRTATTLDWGRPTDQPVTGDWNGDGRTDVGTYQRLRHTFVLRRPSGQPRRIRMGTQRSLPVTGDWDGDGRTEVGTYGPRRGRFTLRPSRGSVTRIAFGSASTVPVSGDWDGDGRTDIGTYAQASGTWRLRIRAGVVRTERLGGRKRLPVTGDWDGDGRTELGVWSPRRATFERAGVAPDRSKVRWGHRRG